MLAKNPSHANGVRTLLQTVLRTYKFENNETHAIFHSKMFRWSPFSGLNEVY